MKKARQWFYCLNEHCSSLGYRQPVANIGQELKGKFLCRTCTDMEGLELRIGVVVAKERRPVGYAEVSK